MLKAWLNAGMVRSSVPVQHPSRHQPPHHPQTCQHGKEEPARGLHGPAALRHGPHDLWQGVAAVDQLGNGGVLQGDGLCLGRAGPAVAAIEHLGRLARRACGGQGVGGPACMQDHMQDQDL